MDNLWFWVQFMAVFMWAQIGWTGVIYMSLSGLLIGGIIGWYKWEMRRPGLTLAEKQAAEVATDADEALAEGPLMPEFERLFAAAWRGEREMSE